MLPCTRGVAWVNNLPTGRPRVSMWEYNMFRWFKGQCGRTLAMAYQQMVHAAFLLVVKKSSGRPAGAADTAAAPNL